MNAVMTTLSISALTAAAGKFGVAAIAAYGIASRLDMLLIPVMFGFGTAVITVVGTSLGSGNLVRARRAALMNALFVAGLVELVGLVVAIAPELWVGLFTNNAAVLAIGRQYLRTVAPLYFGIAIISELYFAGQGAGRIGWPMVAGAVRFLCAVVAGVWVLHGNATLGAAFVLVAFGIAIATAVSLVGFWRVRWLR